MNTILATLFALSAIVVVPVSAQDAGSSEQSAALLAAASGEVLDQSQLATTGYGEVAAGDPRTGQVFTVGLSGLLTRVSVPLANSARSPATGSVHVGIQTLTDEGIPSGNEIGSGTIPLSDIPPAGSPDWVDVAIAAKVTAGTQYALLLSTGGGIVDWL